MSAPTRHDILNAMRQLTVLVRLGYPLSEGLKSMSSESPWLGQLADDMERGDTLAGAMGRQPRLFSPFFRNLVETALASPHCGVTAAKPESVLEGVSRWLERSEATERKMATILLYPALLLIVVLLFVWQALHLAVPGVILPMLVGTPEEAQWRPVLEGLTWLAWPALLGAFVLILSLLGLFRVEPLLTLIPGMGRIRGLATQSLWARGFGSLLAAGVPVLEAFQKSLGVVSVPGLRGQLQEALEKMKRGSSLSEVLSQCPGLESHLVWSVEGGATGDELALRLLNCADELEGQLENSSEHQLRMLGPRALILVGVLAAVGIVVFWWPFYAMTIRL